MVLEQNRHQYINEYVIFFSVYYFHRFNALLLDKVPKIEIFATYFDYFKVGELCLPEGPQLLNLCKLKYRWSLKIAASKAIPAGFTTPCCAPVMMRVA